MRTDVIALVQLLANNSADAALIEEFYDETVIQLAEQRWLTQASVISFSEGQPTVTLPSNLVEMLSLYYDNEPLTEMTLEEMLYIFGESWRTQKGRPRAYTEQAESKKSIEVAPSPNRPSDSTIPIHGLPTGWDYPTYAGIVINSETRNDVPAYLELPLALLILQREYVRESDHQDLAFAAGCGALGDMLLEMMK